MTQMTIRNAFGRLAISVNRSGRIAAPLIAVSPTERWMAYDLWQLYSDRCRQFSWQRFDAHYVAMCPDAVEFERNNPWISPLLAGFMPTPSREIICLDSASWTSIDSILRYTAELRNLPMRSKVQFLAFCAKIRSLVGTVPRDEKMTDVLFCIEQWPTDFCRLLRDPKTTRAFVLACALPAIEAIEIGRRPDISIDECVAMTAGHLALIGERS